MPKTFPRINYGMSAAGRGLAEGIDFNPLMAAVLARKKKKEETELAAQALTTKEEGYQRGKRLDVAMEVFKSSGGQLPSDVMQDIGIAPEKKEEWDTFFKDYFSKQDKAKKQADLSTFNTMLRLGYPISEEKMIENGIDPETAQRLTQELETRSSAKAQTLQSVLEKNRALTQKYLQEAWLTGKKRDTYEMFNLKFQKNDAETGKILTKLETDEGIDAARAMQGEMTPVERNNLFNELVSDMPTMGKRSMIGGVSIDVDASKDKMWLMELKRKLDERDAYSTQLHRVFFSSQGGNTGEAILDLD